MSSINKVSIDGGTNFYDIEDTIGRQLLNDTVGWVNKNLWGRTLDEIKALNVGSGTWSGNVVTWRGITLTFTIEDGYVSTIAVSGTSTDEVNYNLGYITEAGKYIVNGCPANGSNSTYNLRTEVDGAFIPDNYDNGEGSPELTISTSLGIRIIIRNGQTVNLVYKPMIRLASIADATYVPYHASVKKTLADAEVTPNKNLLESIIQGSTGTNGVVNPSVANRVSNNDYIPVNGSSNYVVSSSANVQVIILEFASIGSERINQSAWESVPFAFTTQSATRYVKMMFRYSNDADITPSNVSNPQMETGSIPTAFQPYYIPLKDVVPNKCDNTVIAPVENGATCQNPNGYTAGQHFQHDGGFCTATTTIAYGETLTESTNYTKGDVADYLNIKTADITTTNTKIVLDTYAKKVHKTGNIAQFALKFTLLEDVSTNFNVGILPFMPYSESSGDVQVLAIRNADSPYNAIPIACYLQNNTGAIRVSPASETMQAGDYLITGIYITKY